MNSIPLSSLELFPQPLHESPNSSVYQATLDKSVVVVKRVRITDTDALKRYRAEVALLNDCDHKGVIKPLGVTHVMN